MHIVEVDNFSGKVDWFQSIMLSVVYVAITVGFLSTVIMNYESLIILTMLLSKETISL